MPIPELTTTYLDYLMPMKRGSTYLLLKVEFLFTVEL